MKTALISVYNKTGLSHYANHLLNNDYQILSSGGTYKYLLENLPNYNDRIYDISSYIDHPEILDGRVKTLHPKIHGGILAKRNNDVHVHELTELNIQQIDVVVVNLYPFKEVLNDIGSSHDDLIENIDIGGHTLIRSSAKNYQDVLVVIDPNDYHRLMNEENTVTLRRVFATKAFSYIVSYDAYISSYFERLNFEKKEVCPDTIVRVYEKEQQLKYGANPQQQEAALYKNILQSTYPFKIINGNIGYINVLDAIYAWNLVSELNNNLNLPAAASFKHNSPAGSAVYAPLTDELRKVYNVGDRELSETAVAFIRARNADSMCSYGDFIAISHKVDVPTAKLISIEVSDGIIAPGYKKEALEILRKKKEGNYIILEGMESSHYPYNKTNNYYDNYGEIKEMHGVTLVQESNPSTTNKSSFSNIMTKNKELPEDKKRDMILANTTLKYTQSNSVAFAYDGQCIGIGAGQQSRVDCVKLAKRKTAMWYLRQHPKCIGLFDKFKSGVKRQQKVNAIVRYIEGNFTEIEYQNWCELFTESVELLTDEERTEFLTTLDEIILASDGFFPFSDNIDVASQIGVKYIVQPGGSVADEDIIKAADDYGMCMVFTGSEMRMFLH
jgi:phosphoribosylaminoimidazolecarboxamide formyltransferase/IMP cyclohydrolase